MAGWWSWRTGAPTVSSSSLGRLEGDDVRCLYHGLRFAPNGRCNEIPGLEQAIPDRACVRKFPVEERNSWVWVWMDNEARADTSLIPTSVGHGHPEYVVKSGYLDYDAYYMLINDNLTDLSHLSYVHAASFGADLQWSSVRPKIEALERGIRVSRWIPGSPPIPPLVMPPVIPAWISGPRTNSWFPESS